jgi:predicted nucleic acid-binding protein
MAKTYLMDSNVLIDYAGRKFSAISEQRLDTIFDNYFYYSIISKIEVLGYNATSEVLKHLEAFLKTGEMYRISDEVSDQTILIRRRFPRIKLPDAIIAATALMNNHTLLTRNMDDFKNIPSVNLENPWLW